MPRSRGRDQAAATCGQKTGHAQGQQCDAAWFGYLCSLRRFKIECCHVIVKAEADVVDKAGERAVPSGADPEFNAQDGGARTKLVGIGRLIAARGPVGQRHAVRLDGGSGRELTLPQIRRHQIGVNPLVADNRRNVRVVHLFKNQVALVCCRRGVAVRIVEQAEGRHHAGSAAGAAAVPVVAHRGQAAQCASAIEAPGVSIVGFATTVCQPHFDRTVAIARIGRELLSVSSGFAIYLRFLDGTLFL